MKKIQIAFFVSYFICATSLHAQQFINSGMIEFEVRTNNHKVMGDDSWAELFKDKTALFSTKWYQFTFDHNKAIYRFDRKDEKSKMIWDRGENEDNVWYNDYNNDKFVQYKYVFGDYYLLSDSLMKIQWKLSPNETREIAGFNCRKATGIIFDSVYVFAFYTDEITISGGPMGLSGLPGMILGITIPRMYTSWIATKLEINGIKTNMITAPQKGKKKNATELMENAKNATSQWGNWGQQQIWNIFL